MYRTYDEFHPCGGNTPRHVAIIPDGGRRWAKVHGCTYYESYKEMCRCLYDMIEEIYDKGTDMISVYFSSSQNFRRPKEEIDSFCKAEAEFLNQYAKELYIKYQANVIIVGKKEGIPGYLASAIEGLPVLCLQNRKKLYVCVNYNPHYEIERAVQKATERNDLYINYLDIKEPVDVLIRTGGAKVTSNFLMPQIGFARLFFSDKLFNDFSVEDLNSILNDYAGYTLKYGN